MATNLFFAPGRPSNVLFEHRPFIKMQNQSQMEASRNFPPKCAFPAWLMCPSSLCKYLLKCWSVRELLGTQTRPVRASVSFVWGISSCLYVRIPTRLMVNKMLPTRGYSADVNTSATHIQTREARALGEKQTGSNKPSDSLGGFQWLGLPLGQESSRAFSVAWRPGGLIDQWRAFALSWQPDFGPPEDRWCAKMPSGRHVPQEWRFTWGLGSLWS